MYTYIYKYKHNAYHWYSVSKNKSDMIDVT